jgi:hypothetical protein
MADDGFFDGGVKITTGLFDAAAMLCMYHA